MKKILSFCLIWFMLTGMEASAAETRQTADSRQSCDIGGTGATEEIFVEAGHAGGDGSYHAPFGSLEEARDYIRRLKENGAYPVNGIVVNFREGVYPISETITLGAADSGTAAGPVIYQAYQNEKVEFVGGTFFNPAEAAEVTEESAVGRLDSSVVSKIKQIPLTDLGLTTEDFGEIDLRGSGTSFLFTMGYKNSIPYTDLYFENERMTLARWPNKTEESPYTIVQTVLEPGTDSSVTDKEEARGMTFTVDIPEEKLEKWQGAQDIWVHGFWYYDWSDSSARLAEVDAANKKLTTEHPSAYTVRSGQRFYAYNILEELDEPGEWYLDKETGNLYVYPPGEGDILISNFKKTILSVTGASDIQFKGLDFKGTRSSGIVIRNCTRVGIEDAFVCDTADYGVQIASSESCYLKDSEICSTGAPGAGISGGNFTTLAPGNNYIDNCHIHNFAERDFTNTPGVHISGVGNKLSHNEIHEAPHLAIRFNGNDNIMEYNNIYHVCKDADDAAAIYTFLGVVKRGNIIRHNYIHDMQSASTAPGKIGIYGVYSDGGMCGNIIVSNVFENIAGSGGAVKLGNRDHTVANNIVVNCRSLVRVTGTGLYARGGLTEEEYREKYPYNAADDGLTQEILENPAYDKYPHLKTIAEDEPYVSKYNVIRNNVLYYHNFGNNTDNRLDVAFTHVPSNEAMLKEANPADPENPRTITVAELFPDAVAEELEAITSGMETDSSFLAKEFIRQRNMLAASAVYKSSTERGPGTAENPGFADAENGDYTVLKDSVLYRYFTEPTALPDFQTVQVTNEPPDFANVGLRREPAFRVQKVTINDGDGHRILKLSESVNTVTITVDFANESGTEKPAVLLVGLYSADGRLLKSDYIEETITGDGTQISLRDFDTRDLKKSYLKCFVWESVDSLIPLSKGYQY